MTLTEWIKRTRYAHLPAIAIAITLLCGAAPVRAQQQRDRAPASLDSLLARAVAVQPVIHAAAARVDAAQARVTPAGTSADPMLGVGIMNLPINGSGYVDMTMNAVSVSQTVPYPGRLSWQRRIAVAELEVARAQLVAIQRDVERDVKRAYYEIAFLDRALELVAESETVVATLAQAAEVRYAAGLAPQQELLRLQVEVGRIAEDAVLMTEQRRSVVARLNSLLAQPSDTRLSNAIVAQHIARAAVAENPADISFVANTLGARAANSPLLGVATLQERALAANPELLRLHAHIAVQTARLELAGKAHLPDVDVQLQYGQRPGRPDLMSVMLAVPVPLRRGSRQEQDVAAARAELAALQHEYAAHAAVVHADIAMLHSEAEAARAQLALFARSILPQARAALESATVGFRAGRVEFAALLESRATLYSYELAYHRALTDFARKLAELERVVGAEVIS